MSKEELQPPKIAIRFLRTICPDELYEEIEGDLFQIYSRDVKLLGSTRAKIKFVWNVFMFCRPGIILRNKFSVDLNPFFMMRHFMQIFFRTTVKDLGYSFINISGLTLGLVCSILVGLWVVDEVSFDKFHLQRKKIYQVMGKHKYPDGTFVDDGTPGPLSDALKSLSDVDESCRVTFVGGKTLFQYDGKSLYEQGMFAESSFLKIFTLNIVDGDSQDLLSNNNSIIISRKLATKYFNDEQAVGKIIELNNKWQAKVTAVFEDIPTNTTLRFDFILPYALYANDDKYNNERGAWTGGFTYVKLKDDASTADVEKQIAEKFTKPHIWERWDSNVDLFLFPMKDWHLYNRFTNGVQDGGRIDYVKIFSALGVFILLIASINFVNLATARSMKRAKEIGVRKVIGAGRKSLFFQFIFECLLVTSVAMIAAIVIVTFVLPSFNALVDKQLVVPYKALMFYVSVASAILTTSLFAGVYPAIFLSSFKVLNVLKGKMSGVRGLTLRNALVVFQFTLSVTLIVCALMANEQIGFIKSKNLGFDRENIIYFRPSDRMLINIESFRNEALQSPLIKSVAEGNTNPMQIQSGMVLSDNAWPGKSKNDNVVFRWMQCDHDYLSTLGFEIVKGRNFSKDVVSDSSNYIINEEAVRKMRLSDPIGQTLFAPHAGKIIGVVKDFHSLKLQFGIQPVIIAMKPAANAQIFIKYEEGKAQEALTFLQALYKKYDADFPMEYKFMDDPLDQQYKDEMMIEKLAKCFTVIAIFISCLGLIGLTSYTTETRAKEIGIRKVMGASVHEIIKLLSKDFIMLVSVAFVIGAALGWWAVERFLNDYAFRVPMSVGTIILAATILVVVTLIAVSYQSAKAAITNPVKTLKRE